MISLPLILALATSACCAISIPRGTQGAIVNINNNNEFRIFHQSDSSLGIKEISVGLPTKLPVSDPFIFGGPTRRNSPLAAITWTDEGASNPQVCLL
jgi:hypothetical protein